MKTHSAIILCICAILLIFIIALFFPRPALIKLTNSDSKKSELIYELGYKTATMRVLEGNFNTSKKRDSLYKIDSIDFNKFINKRR